MKEKTSEPKPMVQVKYSKNHKTEIFALDEGDAMAWNRSTNYDHHMQGPSLVSKRSQHGDVEIHEYYVNDPNAWLWINQMVQLGWKFIENNPDFDVLEFQRKVKKEMEEYEPHVSWHSQTDES